MSAIRFRQKKPFLDLVYTVPQYSLEILLVVRNAVSGHTIDDHKSDSDIA